MKKIVIPLTIAAILIAGGCNEKSSKETSMDTEVLISQYVDYDPEDYYTDWEDEVFTKIILNDEASTFDGSGGVIINGQNIEIQIGRAHV